MDTADLQTVDLDSSLSFYAERFEDLDDLVVVLVGDLDLDELRGLAAKYLATLPATDRVSYHAMDERTGAYVDSWGSADLTRTGTPLVISTGVEDNIHNAAPCLRWENRGGTAAHFTQADITKQPDYDDDAGGCLQRSEGTGIA